MSRYRALLLTAALLGAAPAALAHGKPTPVTPAASPNPETYWTTPHTVSTSGRVKVGGHIIRYTAKAGMLILRDTLHFGAGHRYVFLSASVGNDWKWLHTPPGAGSPAPIAPNVLPDLATTMTLDPRLKVLVNAGYFDLATPYYAAMYQMRQLPMQPDLQKNVEFRFYHTGHMIYVRPQGLAHLHANIAQFIRQTE